MKRSILMFAITAVAAVICGCSDKPNGGDAKFEPITKVITDVSSGWGSEYLAGQWVKWDEARLNTVFVINAQSEMDKFIAEGAVEVPEIDFATKTLLLVWGQTNYGIHAITKEFKQTELSEFALNVDITTNAACVMDRWVIALTTSKIVADSVTLNLKAHI